MISLTKSYPLQSPCQSLCFQRPRAYWCVIPATSVLLSMRTVQDQIQSYTPNSSYKSHKRTKQTKTKKLPSADKVWASLCTPTATKHDLGEAQQGNDWSSLDAPEYPDCGFGPLRWNGFFKIGYSGLWRFKKYWRISLCKRPCHKFVCLSNCTLWKRWTRTPRHAAWVYLCKQCPGVSFRLQVILVGITRSDLIISPSRSAARNHGGSVTIRDPSQKSAEGTVTLNRVRRNKDMCGNVCVTNKLLNVKFRYSTTEHKGSFRQGDFCHTH